VSANNHQEYIGRLWVKPGITLNEEVFLEYNLVTVEWRVKEIAIQDKYDILLTATYETNVPAPVVVAEPMSIKLPEMKAGDVYNGEFTLTNYGLIRADNLTFSLPGDDANFKYEVLVGLPKSLGAKERVTVPYRMVCLQALSAAESQGTGGGCGHYRKCVIVNYKYKCANGRESSGSTQHCWFYSYGECTGSSGGGGWMWYGGIGGGSYSSPAPAPAAIRGIKCFPAAERKECNLDACARQKDTRQDTVLPVGSSVNLVTREYADERVDLVVKVPGGVVEVKRLFYGNQWHWEHGRNNLKFDKDSSGEFILALEKGGVQYKKPMNASGVYLHDTYKIAKVQSGFRWGDQRGNWIDYDVAGRMLAYGNRSGITVLVRVGPSYHVEMDCISCHKY
jgi:hypothetical protein